MERIKRFLLDERATSEAVSEVIMIACVGAILSVGLLAYYGAFNTFFNTVSSKVSAYTFPTIAS